MFHDGTSVQEGVKYIMRTDVIFKRIKTSNLPIQDPEAEARRLLRMAEELERSGQAELATTYYKKAFNMSKKLADEYGY
jgi:Tfp pilus assembly protein PilF